MKRNVPLARRTGLRRGPGPKRKPMKRSQPRRNWKDARKKVEREGVCRVCGFGMVEGLEAAHVIGREHDRCLSGSSVRYVNPDSVVPLCGGVLTRGCHGKYDAHQLDLLPYLTGEEKEQALRDLDWDVFAFLHRTTGRMFGPLPESEAA